MGALIRSGAVSSAAAGVAEVALQGRQYLTFSVSGERFAMPIAAIREIIEFRAPTEVPMMPDYIRGVINLRGRVVPVIDLAARFGRDKGEVTKRSCIVILELRDEATAHDISVLVDAVSTVVEIPDGEIEPPPNFGARLRADFISGMGKIGGRFVIILDVDRVLSIEELAGLERVAGGETGVATAPESQACQAA